MPCNKIYSNNLITENDTEITVDSENAFFPISNITDPRTTKVFRTPNGTLSATIVFDFKTAEPVDSIIVIGDKLNGLGFASMLVEANPNNVWGSPAFSTTLVPNQKFNFGYADASADLPTYRFWRLTVTGAASYIELSNIFIGQEIPIGRSVDLNWSYKNVDKSTFTTNRYGQRFTDIRNRQKEISIGYSILSKTEFPPLQDAIDENGEHTPFWIIMDPDELISDGVGRFAGQFYLIDAPTLKNTFYQRYDVKSIRFVEAI